MAALKDEIVDITVDNSDDQAADPDLHLLMSTDEPDNFTSYEDFAERYKAFMYFNDDDDDFF